MLRTQRLELRQHTEGNIEKLHKWFNDKELLFYDDEGAYEEISMEEMQELMTNRLMKCVLKDHKEIIHLGIHKVEVVESVNSGELIGFCMIAFIDKYNKKCKLGITIGEKQEWGKGYAYEALQSLVDFCFDTLGLQRIEVGIYSFNTRSIKVFEKLGFIEEGTLRNCVLKNGIFQDEKVYGLLKDEWERIKTAKPD